MAGAGAKLFVSGDVLTAAQVNTYLMDQTIMTFASTSARDAAFGAGKPTLAEGMFAYTTDTNTLWLYTGATDGWVNLLGSSIGQQALSNRNVVINGAMQVAQRGTSTASITTGGYYTVDRFQSVVNTQGTWTMSQEADAPTGSGFRNSVKMLVTTADASPAADDQCALAHLIEGQNLQQFAKGTSSAKQFSLSFWVKSNVTGTYVVNLVDIDNTRICSATYSISASATWEKKTITFPADTTGAFDNDNAASLNVRFMLGAGSNRTSGTLNTTWAAQTTANIAVGQTNVAAATNNYWQVTGVQLEAGAVATPFEFEQYGVTLAKCQRYYYRTTGSDNSVYANAMAYSTTQIYANLQFPVTMRVTPGAIETSGTASHYKVTLNTTAGQACTSVPTFIIATTNTGTVTATSTTGNLVQGDASYLSSGSLSGYLGFSAEL